MLSGDSTTSLYTSPGGGIIGAGARPTVAAAGTAWLSTIEQHLDVLPAATGTQLPASGFVVIRALCFDGQRAVMAPENDLGRRLHPASAMFLSAHGVITELRLIDEARPS